MKLYLVLSGESDMHRSCGPRLKAGEDAHAQRPPRNSLRPAPLHYRMLASYWYFKSLNFDRSLPKFYTKPYPNIFADCGAFSAHQQRQVIEVAEYADWLHRWRHLFDAYANLDVIGSAEDTLRNQRYLEGRGLAPVPVFHAGDPWSVLEELLAEHPYIALGGMVGAPGGRFNLYAWLVRCFEMANGRAVFHGFGLTSWGALASFPWHSVDSSAWSSAYRHLRMSFFDERPSVIVQKDIRNGNHAEVWKRQREIEGGGYSPHVMLTDTQAGSRQRGCFAAYQYMRAEAYLTKYWGDVVIPQRNPKGDRLEP